MPMGTHHRLTGLLVRDATGFALEADGGGRWRLDVSDDTLAERLLGRRVNLTGTRCGFDLLEVDGMTLL